MTALPVALDELPPIETPTTDLRRRALAVPLQVATWPLAERYGIEVLIRRDDLIDQCLSGNKFYKLFYNLQAARAAKAARLISFGGAWSNHLHALAAAGKRYGVETVGIVRGARPHHLSATLRDAEAWGMRLHFLARVGYANKTDEVLQAQLEQIIGPGYWIPEGGGNHMGSEGAAEIGCALHQQLLGNYQHVCLPVGTGSTLAGVVSALPADKRVLGFSVLKGEGTLAADIARRVDALTVQRDHAASAQWSLISGYHGGGYGRKLSTAVLDFWQTFERDTGVLLDPVYTVKMLWGISQLMQQSYWPRGTRLVVVHTGGLQGRRGFTQQITWSHC